MDSSKKSPQDRRKFLINLFMGAGLVGSHFTFAGFGLRFLQPEKRQRKQRIFVGLKSEMPPGSATARPTMAMGWKVGAGTVPRGHGAPGAGLPTGRAKERGSGAGQAPETSGRRMVRTPRRVAIGLPLLSTRAMSAEPAAPWAVRRVRTSALVSVRASL